MAFDATDDLDIRSRRLRICAILRLHADAPRFTIEALDRGLAVEHCDDDFAHFRRFAGANDDEIAVENRASTIESPCTRSMNASETRGTKPAGKQNSPSTSSCRCDVTGRDASPELA